MTSNWRHIVVDATSLRRIDVITTSFQRHVPARVFLYWPGIDSQRKIYSNFVNFKHAVDSKTGISQTRGGLGVQTERCAIKKE